MQGAVVLEKLVGSADVICYGNFCSELGNVDSNCEALLMVFLIDIS